MKLTRITLFVFLFIQLGYGQGKPLFYYASSLEAGNYGGLDFSLTFVHKSNYSFSAGLFFTGSTPNNYPEDRDSSNDLPFSGMDSSINYYLSVGKIIPIPFKNSNVFRWNISAGLAYTEGSILSNFVRESESYSGSGFVYSNDTDLYESMSLILTSKLELFYFGLAGLYAYPKVVINSKKSFYGIGFGYMIGKVR